MNLNLKIKYVFFIRHSDAMVKHLESAGLGYHVTGDQSYEKFGMSFCLFHLICIKPHDTIGSILKIAMFHSILQKN